MTIKVRGRTPIGRMLFPTQTLTPENGRFLFDFSGYYPYLSLLAYDQAVKVLPPRVENGIVFDRIEHTQGSKTVTKEGAQINEPKITGKKGVFFGGVEVEVVSVPPDKPPFWRRSRER